MKTLTLILSLLLTACGGGSEPLPVEKPVHFASEPTGVELVAHRGIGGKDNTIESFTNALNLGFTSLETDLRMQGKKVVLAHDKTLSNEWYESLEDFLIFASNNNARLWLEAKETETIEPMVELLKQHNLDVVFFSVRQSDVNLAKSLMPSLETGLLITREEQIKDISADWVAIYHPFLKRNYDKIKHLKIAAWTFQNQEEYDDIKHLIDAAISDVELIK